MLDHIFAIIGGDNRQGYLANVLQSDGYKVIACGLAQCPGLDPSMKQMDTKHAVGGADVIVLPLPVSTDNVTVQAPFSFEPIYLAEIYACVRSDTMILGGKLNEKLTAAAKSRGILICDYLDREELSILNAIPTAEGALEIAMRETKHTIFGSNCLVAGYGRIGKILSRILRDLGAHVWVSARKYPDLSMIQSEHLMGINMASSTTAAEPLSSQIDKFDIIFNTVPAMIFDKDVLMNAKPTVLMIDLASVPGVDFDVAQNMGIRLIQALSLPGKVAPITAASMIKDTILNILREAM